MQHQEVSIPPLAFSFAKGFLRTLLPDVEGDKLIFRAKGDAKLLQAVATVTGVNYAMFLTARQAVWQTMQQQTPQLRGTVTFSDGTPVTTGTIQFETPTFLAQGDIRPDGTYTIGSIPHEKIPHGEYIVNIRGAEKEVLQTPQLHGTVTFSDGTPVTTGTIQFETPTFLARGDIRPDGAYAIGSIPHGEYIVSIHGTEEVASRFQHSVTSGISIAIQGTMQFDIMVDRHVER